MGEGVFSLMWTPLGILMGNLFSISHLQCVSCRDEVDTGLCFQ